MTSIKSKSRHGDPAPTRVGGMAAMTFTFCAQAEGGDGGDSRTQKHKVE